MASKQKIHFEVSERKILLRIMDVVFVLTTLQILSHFFEFGYFKITATNFYWTIFLAIYINLFGTIFEMYNLHVANNRFQTTKSVLLTTSVTVLIYLLTPFYTPILPSNRLQIIFFFLGIFLSLSVWRNLYIIFLGSNRFIKRVVFIGSSKRIDEFANELIKGNPHYLVSGYLATDDKNFPTNIEIIDKDNFLEYLRKNFISEVVVTVDSNKTMAPEIYEVMLQALESGISISEYSEVYETGTNRLPIHFYDKEMFKFFPFSRSNQNKLYLFYTRLFDVVFSLIGLTGLLILLPFILLCNAFGNRGPLFYKQERVGKNGEIFNIVKLRTMVVDAEKEGAVFAKVNDTRITKFGKFLRKSRLDEVPQFINVLKGDMAVIGPRPERLVFVEQIAENIPLYKTRHVVKPGLTGWAQVNYPYGENLEDSLMKLRYDLFYIKHRSLFLDVNIFVKTLSTVLFFRGQ